MYIKSVIATKHAKHAKHVNMLHTMLARCGRHTHYKNEHPPFIKTSTIQHSNIPWRVCMVIKQWQFLAIQII